MKRFLSLFLAFIMLFTFAPLSGVSKALDSLCGTIEAEAKDVFTDGFCGDTSNGSNGKNLKWELKDGTLTVSGTGKMTDKSPFIDDLRIEKAVIESGVTSLGESAFSGCANLKEIKISDSVSEIGKFAFYSCSSLVRIAFPEKVTVIPYRACYCCTSLCDVSVSSSLTEVGEDAFYECASLENIKLPDSVSKIGSSAFRHSGLTSISLPKGLSEISLLCFANTKITDIVIPDNIVEICFAGFAGVKFESLKIGRGLKKIGRAAFEGDGKIKELTIPDNVEYIDEDAFNFSTLEKVTIGKNVSYMKSPFSQVGNLTTVTIDKDNTNFHVYDNVLYNSDYSEIVWVKIKREKITFPKELNLKSFSWSFLLDPEDIDVCEYAIEDEAEKFAVIDGVLYSKDLTTLYSCPIKRSKKLVIPDSVTKVCDSACENVSCEIELSKNLKYIGAQAFMSCGTSKTNRKDLVLPNSIETIESGAFANNYYNTVYLPDNLKSMDVFAFGNTAKIKEVHIGKNTKFEVNDLNSSYEYFGYQTEKFTVSDDNPYFASYDNALYSKDLSELLLTPYNISSIKVPKETSSFGTYPKNTTEIVVDENNPYFSSDGIFLMSKDKTKLYRIQDKEKSVTIPNTVKTFDDKFTMSTSKTKILTFPDSVTELPIKFSYYASYYYLEELNIPGSVKKVDTNGAEFGCLTKVNFGEGVEEIKSSESAPELEDIVLPESCKCFTIQPEHAHEYSMLKNIVVKNKNCAINGSIAISSDSKITGYCGSTAHRVAVKRKAEFISLGHDYLNWYTYKPATYEEEGIERRDCAYCDHYEERTIPKLKKETHTATFMADGKVVSTVNFYSTMTKIEEPAVPAKDRYIGEWEDYTLGDEDIVINAKYTLIKADDASDIDADSSIDYYYNTDDVLFKLKASAKAKTVKSSISKSVPLDIVLVVDQSGSMDEKLGGSQKKVDALKDAAQSFVNKVADNAKLTGANHRIAIAGFGLAGSYRGYKYNENTELLTSKNGKSVSYQNITPSDYSNAMVNVLDGKNVNPILTNAVDSIEAKGATAADLGLEMAKGIYANTGSSGRERLVVFMTDGEPTYSNGFDIAVANSAIANASVLKNTYKASIYSVGIFNSSQIKDYNIDRFMNAVSSDCPYSSSFRNIGAYQSDHYFITVDNTDSLSNVFKTITTESLSHTAPFDKVTLTKTLSKYVTLTSVQEKNLRESLIREYNISNDDIKITRNDDGTTFIKISNLVPKEVTDDKGNVSYEVNASFFASLNENASKAGDYYVDTEDSGVILGDANGYEATFAPSKITLEKDKKRFVFKINNEVYDITEGDIPSKAIPDTEFSSDWDFYGWVVDDKNAVNGTVYNATLEKKNRTVIWHMEGGDVSQTYKEGDIITPPAVSDKSDGSKFISWNRSLPTLMPDENLEFTAVYGQHVHKFTSEIVKPASCTEDGITKYSCSCGETSTQTVPATGHNFEAITPTTENDSSRCTFVCTNCGKKYEYALDYQITDASRNRSKIVYEFKLTDDNLDTGFEPDGTIYIRIPLSEVQGKARYVRVQRTNDDGSKTTVPAYISDGYLWIEADHFTPYEVNLEFDCETTGNHVDNDNDGYCDNCNAKVNPKVNITIGKTDLGTVSGDIVSNGSKVTKEFNYGDVYTVTAEGSDFLGWEINGKLVSSSPVYSGVAYTDLTLTPVFKIASEGNINVFFYDKYGNLFKKFEDVTVDEYRQGIKDGIPQAPNYPGYVFTGYNKSESEIKSNTQNAAFVAQYEKSERLYTVTAKDGASLIIDGKAAGAVATVPYDTKVTVKKDNAAGWTVNSKTVAYGSLYTFYVGSDVEVAPLDNAVKENGVSIIDVSSDAPYYTFLATHTGDIAERGFIYGKNVDDSSLESLESAKSAAGVKIKISKVTSVEQFSLTLKATTSGTLKVRSFVIDKSGNIYYSDIATVEAAV